MCSAVEAMSLGLPKYCSVLKSGHTENTQVNTRSFHCTRCPRANVIITWSGWCRNYFIWGLEPRLLGLLFAADKSHDIKLLFIVQIQTALEIFLCIDRSNALLHRNKLIIPFSMNFKHSLEVRDTALSPVCLIAKFCIDIWLEEPPPHIHIHIHCYDLEQLLHPVIRRGDMESCSHC